MKQAAPDSGLYAITDTGLLDNMAVDDAVEKAILGGARMIQYREKNLRGAALEAAAARLATLCRHHGVPLIINDDIDLAVRCGASGVHLGREDSPLPAAREQLGDEAIIGISCYDSLARASEAVAAGADYVAFGRFYPSRSKPQAVPADPSLLTRARASLDVPVVAIGGITPANGAALLAAGAGLLAAIEGVFGQPDIVAAARAYADLFEP